MSLLHTKRPVSVRAVDTLAGLARRVGIAPRIEAESLLAEARRRSGLPDPADGPWREGLEYLCTSLRDEAALSPLGAWILREQYAAWLVQRFRKQALLTEHPEILDQDLLPPVIVTGLQRTGTTKLQRLLAADPRARPLLSWEALEPIPGAADTRIRSARTAAAALRWINPSFFAIHPIEHESPEEEVLLLDPTFHSTTPEAMCSVPGFAAWLEVQDHTWAYQELRETLLILQWQRGGQWWVLKTPHHLEFLDVLFAVIPETRLVWTHRDPITTVGSLCSMLFHGRRMFSDAVSAEEVGAQWGRKIGRMVDLGLAFRDAHPEAPVLDVSYDELLRDPLAAVRTIHAFAGLPDPDESAVRQALAEQTQHRYGVHRYRLEDFGLSPEGVAARFADYRRRFGFEEPA